MVFLFINRYVLGKNVRDERVSIGVRRILVERTILRKCLSIRIAPDEIELLTHKSFDLFLQVVCDELVVHELHAHERQSVFPRLHTPFPGSVEDDVLQSGIVVIRKSLVKHSDFFHVCWFVLLAKSCYFKVIMANEKQDLRKDIAHLKNYVPQRVCQFACEHLSGDIRNLDARDMIYMESVLQKYVRNSTRYTLDKHSRVLRDTGYMYEVIRNDDCKVVSRDLEIHLDREGCFLPYMTFLVAFSRMQVLFPLIDKSYVLDAGDALIFPCNWFYPFAMRGADDAPDSAVCMHVNMFCYHKEVPQEFCKKKTHVYKSCSTDADLMTIGKEKYTRHMGLMFHFQGIVPVALCNTICEFVAKNAKDLRSTLYHPGENTVSKNLLLEKIDEGHSDFDAADRIDKALKDQLQKCIETISHEFGAQLSASSYIDNIECDSGFNLRIVEGPTRCHTDGPQPCVRDSATCYRIGTFIGCFSECDDIITFPQHDLSIKLKKGDILFFPPYILCDHMTDFKYQNVRFVTWLMGKARDTQVQFSQHDYLYREKGVGGAQ